MSASTQLNLQHEHIKQPIIAGVVVLLVISAGILLFSRIAGAEAEPHTSDVPKASSVGSSSSVHVHTQSSQTSSSDDAQNHSSTNITVNGQDVPVDASGSVHKTFSSDNGQSTVNISVDNHSSSEDSR